MTTSPRYVVTENSNYVLNDAGAYVITELFTFTSFAIKILVKFNEYVTQKIKIHEY